jgi:hypothetical protein
MPKAIPAILLSLFATLFPVAPSRAAESDRALLSTFCDAANIKGSTCTRAKGYPDAPRRGCDVALRAERYSGKFLGAGNPLLVVFYDSGCESHATDEGGAAVFEQAGGAYTFKNFQPGMIGSDCVTSAKDARQDLLVCLTGHMGQGLLESGVALMQFKPVAGGHIGLSLDMLLTAEDATGAYGTNIVSCNDSQKYFEVSKLAAGPRAATVIVDTTYADAELIATVCRKDYPKPVEAIGLLAPGDAYVPTGREKSGTFIVDLATRKIAPQ